MCQTFIISNKTLNKFSEMKKLEVIHSSFIELKLSLSINNYDFIFRIEISGMIPTLPA